MELLQLRYFCTVARMESITNAAQSLQISQPSLSKTIINLEKELGTALFDRLGRHIHLNEKGKQYYEQVRDGLELIDNAQNQLLHVESAPRGEISLLILAASAMLPNLIASFLKKAPGIHINLHQQTCHDLRYSDDYDFSISATPMDYTGLELTPLLTEELMLAVPAAHPLASRKQIALSEASDCDFIAFSRGPSLRVLTDSLCFMAGFAPKIIFESDGVAGLYTMIENEVGVCLVPAGTHREFDPSRIRLLPITDPPCSRTIHLAWRRGKYLNSSCMLFRQHVTDYFSGLSQMTGQLPVIDGYL